MTTTKKAVFKYSCIKCEKEFIKEYFNKFDEEIEAGVCFDCEKPEAINAKSYNRILALGTPEQINDIKEKAELYYRYKAAQSKKDEADKPAPEPVSDLKNALYFFKGRVEGKPYMPTDITYKNYKRIFWEYYRLLVFRETDIKVNGEDLEKETVDFLVNYLKYILKDNTGAFDINKSLFIYGDLGVGKTTIVTAGRMLTHYIRATKKVKQIYYTITSMDELFLETYTKQSLEEIGKLSQGFICLDELRDKHVSYKHYGSEYYILSDILTARHNLWKRTGVNTIITSNITPNKLSEELKDPRLTDRIKQQYTAALLKGTNKRHLKQ